MGSIEGAVNIPLFTEEERKNIGITYKQISINDARKLGVSYISKKMPLIFDYVAKLKEKNNNLTAFCARGGYRSTFFSSSFSSIGMHVSKLDGGYKEYRKTIIKELPNLNDKVTYIVLHGNTGVGKTEILKILKNKGLDILDFEMAANHRGSLLGGIGLGESYTQKTFESKIYNWLDKRNSKYIFVEAESKRIGKITIPKYIHERMKNGIHIFIDANINHRVDVLKKDYIINDHWVEEAIQSVQYFKKHISNNKVEELIKEIEKKNFDYVAKELMENYYDPMYRFKSDKYNYSLVLENIRNSEEASNKIIKWFNEYKRNSQ